MKTERTLLSIRRDSKGRIFSHIRQTWLVETPEELVRQEYVCALVNEYEYKLEQMAEEMAPPGVRGKGRARVEIEQKHQPEIEKRTYELQRQIDAAVEAEDAGGPDQTTKIKALSKELNDFEKSMAEMIAAESRALLKQRFNYPVFLYEAEHVGITATGEPDVNELYPNERQPTGGVKTCVELYREFRKNPESFFVHGPTK